MGKKDGGPAYPAKIVKEDIAGNRRHSRHGGMTLRDWFAGQALTGIVRAAIQQRDDSTIYWTDVAERAYGLADAMLAERNK